MATDVEDSEMEGSPEFKHALKMVLKRQMKDLINQICEQGIEIAVMEVNINDGSTSHFGTPIGESFIAEQKSLTHSFASFCKTNGRISSDVPSDRSPRRRVEKKITPMSKSRPSTSTDPPTLRITVPRRLSVGISEQELGGLVGRIVASQLDKNKEKGDGSSGGTKFDALLESVKAKEKPLNVTRSGRKVSNKFLEGLKSSKKSIKAEESESGDEGSSEKLIGRLSDLETQAMKKVQVKTGDGKSVDVQKTTLVQGDQLESLAAAIIKELQRVPNIADRKQVKVLLYSGDEKQDIVIEYEETDDEMEPMDDSDMEYDDYTNLAMGSGGETDEMIGAVDRDQMKDLSHNQPKIKTRKRKSKKKSLIETMPLECEHCGVYIAGKSNLKCHISRVHLKIKSNKCTICPMSFWSKASLDSHVLTIHTRKCEQCGAYAAESVPWKEGMDKRMPRSVLCGCGAVVSIYTAFGRKRVMSDDEGDDESPNKVEEGWACRTCNKIYTKKMHCIRHERTHTVIPDQVCHLCDEEFVHESSLTKHLEEDHSIVMHKCVVCGRKYNSETSLKVHYIKNHKNELVNKTKQGKEASSEPSASANDKQSVIAPRMQITAKDTSSLLEKLHPGQTAITHSNKGSIYVTTRNPELTSDAAREFVQQAIADGHLDVPEGEISIILTQI
ncbi:zinc finger protein 37-like isoform X6 [Dreissena polymorpha]|uniref:zinc finger protein 37-like isoform X6 n=1 Tax=Dreissena polymorpha TaxID=45954 RepID=UPI0022650C88|nr:zinc finger protein 37-like isoform X6 [Dreissena polymorpha]